MSYSLVSAPLLSAWVQPPWARDNTKFPSISPKPVLEGYCRELRLDLSDNPSVRVMRARLREWSKANQAAQVAERRAARASTARPRHLDRVLGSQSRPAAVAVTSKSATARQMPALSSTTLRPANRRYQQDRSLPRMPTEEEDPDGSLLMAFVDSLPPLTAAEEALMLCETSEEDDEEDEELLEWCRHQYTPVRRAAENDSTIIKAHLAKISDAAQRDTLACIYASLLRECELNAKRWRSVGYREHCEGDWPPRKRSCVSLNASHCSRSNPFSPSEPPLPLPPQPHPPHLQYPPSHFNTIHPPYPVHHAYAQPSPLLRPPPLPARLPDHAPASTPFQPAQATPSVHQQRSSVAVTSPDLLHVSADYAPSQWDYLLPPLEAFAEPGEPAPSIDALIQRLPPKYDWDVIIKAVVKRQSGLLWPVYQCKLPGEYASVHELWEHWSVGSVGVGADGPGRLPPISLLEKTLQHHWRKSHIRTEQGKRNSRINAVKRITRAIEAALELSGNSDAHAAIDSLLQHHGLTANQVNKLSEALAKPKVPSAARVGCEGDSL